MNFLAVYIMQNRIQAIVTVSVFALLSLLFPPLNIVSSASIALITLRHGATEGGYVLICSSIICGLAGFFLIDSYQLPLVYSLILWIPIWIVSFVLRETRHLFLAIEVAVILVCIAIVVGYFIQPDLANVWRLVLNKLLESVLIEANPTVDVKAIQYSLSIFYQFVMTGLIAQIYLIMLLSGLFLGRYWQATLYNQGGFKKEYLSLKAQSELGFTAGGVLLVGILSNGTVAQVCWAVFLLLFMLYAFIGTVVLHGVFMAFKARRFIVPCLYLTMLLVPYVIVPVAIIGLTDNWLNLRNKIPNLTSR